MIDQNQDEHIVSIRAEQAVLDALLTDSEALDRIADLGAQHFYRHDHRLIFGFDSEQTTKNSRQASSPLDLVAYPNGAQSSSRPQTIEP
jgi:replicative DNA helicase